MINRNVWCQGNEQARQQPNGRNTTTPVEVEFPGVAMAWDAFSHPQAKHVLTWQGCRTREDTTTPRIGNVRLLLSSWVTAL
jgi:hypothetical protein